MSSDGAKMQWLLCLVFVVGQSWFITGQLYEYRYIKESKNWTAAQEYCREHYTDLATISNMTDMKRLNDSAKNRTQSAWIGLHSPILNGNRTWHWSLPGLELNESEVEWDKDEPNKGTGEEENCGAIRKNLKLLDLSCHDKRSFICYDERNKTQRFFFINQSMTWLEAQSYCRENHTDLASGPDQLNDTQLQQLPELQKLNGTEENNHAFIGLYRDTWRWSDGSSFSFRHWRPGSGISTKHIWYVMVEKNGRWTTDESSDSKNPFFCYDDKVILIQQNLTWEDALYYCREKHRDLVSITDLNDQRWVQERVKNATTEYVWTGLRYTCTLDFWFWVGGEVVTYQNVDPGQKGDHCDMSGAMQRAGKHKWFKKNDMNEFNFLCSEW